MMTRSAMLFALAAMLAAGCSTVEPGAGEQAVLVYKPMFFGAEGVDPKPVDTGLTYVALTTEAVMVPKIPLRVDMAFDDMMTKSGVPVDFHIVLTFDVTDWPLMVREFGADRDEAGNWGFFARNLEQPIRTNVRDSVKAHEMQDIAINASAVESVQRTLVQALDTIVKDTGVPVSFKPGSVNVGRVLPPKAISDQRIETATQEQRIITEQQRRLAEDQRKLAEEARAAADNAYNEQMRLSPAQYVELERIKMMREACGKAGACTFLLGAEAVPLVSVK